MRTKILKLLYIMAYYNEIWYKILCIQNVNFFGKKLFDYSFAYRFKVYYVYKIKLISILVTVGA
jgi:hypothetical protein